jgi:riboflavin biosynthesis pyrimidine reductase
MAQTPGALAPFEVLLERAAGAAAPLPEPLARLYGRFAFPEDTPGGVWVISNFVASIDGVVAFSDQAVDPIPRNLAEIGGSDPHDRAVMGLLRAMADAVIVGSGTLRAVPKHLWLPGFISPAYAPGWAALRAALGKLAAPLAVIVSGSGAVDAALPVFHQADAPALIVTSPQGAGRLADAPLGPRAGIIVGGDGATLTAQSVLDATRFTLDLPGAARPGARLILVEGGPRLLGQFLAEGLLDEQFLTIAPQFAGRDEQARRPGLIEGQRLIPQRPTWARLISVRVAGEFLFLRYRLRGLNLLNSTES